MDDLFHSLRMLHLQKRTSEAFCQLQIQLLKLLLKSLKSLFLVGHLTHEVLPNDLILPGNQHVP